MSEFIEVGVTAMRDPTTGNFLPAVPLYIRAEDQGKVTAPVFDSEFMRKMAGKFAEYKKEERKAKKKAPKATSKEEIAEKLEEKMREYAEEKKRNR